MYSNYLLFNGIFKNQRSTFPSKSGHQRKLVCEHELSYCRFDKLAIYRNEIVIMELLNLKYSKSEANSDESRPTNQKGSISRPPSLARPKQDV